MAQHASTWFNMVQQQAPHYHDLYLEEPLGTFFCPRRLGSRIIRHFHPEVCKTRQIYCILMQAFLSQDVFCAPTSCCAQAFLPGNQAEKQGNLGGKKRNQAEFCQNHFSALNNMTRPYNNLSASAFFLGLFILGIGRNKRLQAGQALFSAQRSLYSIPNRYIDYDRS